jgi:hypothetical protein
MEKKEKNHEKSKHEFGTKKYRNRPNRKRKEKGRTKTIKKRERVLSALSGTSQ